MAREATGSILTRALADGSCSYRLRFRAAGQRQEVFLHERAGCRCGCGGGWSERAARTELGNILARVRAGVWQPPAPSEAQQLAGQMPLFGEYAQGWLQGRIDGVTGAKPLAANTITCYRGLLDNHLRPFFAGWPVDQIDRQACQTFKARVLREAAELREAIQAGADLRDQRNRRLVPLAPATIRKAINLLAAILDEAIEDELITQNPARARRMRVHVPKPSRSFLEVDELAAMIQTAAEQDAPPAIPAGELRGDSTRARVARRLAAGGCPKQIALDLGLAKATVSFHAARLGVQAHPYTGRRAVIEILGRSGIRASELCDLRIGDLRLHDPDGARLHIRDSKTETGIREVQLTPHLAEAITDHLDRLQRAGQPTGPDAHLIPSQRGGRLSRQRVGKIVGEAAQITSQRLQAQGRPPLVNITPHSLRRTYISIALVANNFDVKWVMSQVGHADSHMTLDVYAQLEQRIRRDHGRSFDWLLAAADPSTQADAAGVQAAALAHAA